MTIITIEDTEVPDSTIKLTERKPGVWIANSMLGEGIGTTPEEALQSQIERFKHLQELFERYG